MLHSKSSCCRLKPLTFPLFFLLLFGFAFPLISDQLDDVPQHKKVKFKWDFAITTIFQNEAPYLKEWIEFHKLVGAQHFYMYNNLSSDDFLSVLEPYIDSGLVELIDWPYDNNGPDEFNRIATRAFSNAVKRAKGKAKWLAILDSDEFLYVVDGRKIQDSLAPLIASGHAGVLVHWYMFGTSFVPKIPDNKLMIETLILTGGKHPLYKTICRPDYVKKVVNQHYCTYRSGRHVLEDSSNLGDLRINHYWTRDEDYFNNVKIPRREKYATSRETSELWNSLMNAYSDDAIQHYILPLRINMGLVN